MSQQRAATGLMRPPVPKDRHQVAPALKGHLAAFHCCRHQSAPVESRQTRTPAKTPNRYVSFRSPNAVVSIDHTVLGTPRGTETACQPSRLIQTARGNSRGLPKSCPRSSQTRVWITAGTCLENRGSASRYIVSPVPFRTLAAASTLCVRRKDNSYSAREVHDDKNEQNGSKNAATNIHFYSPPIIDSVLEVGSAGAVWAVPHRSRPANRLRYDGGWPNLQLVADSMHNG
jgi:hypothetical protein